MVIEQATVQPTLGNTIATGILFGEPPEEACNVVVLVKLSNQFTRKLCLSLNGDRIELCISIFFGPRIILV